MASQPGSQGSHAGPVALPLLKYSYATVPMGSVAPIPWVHLSNMSNLIAYFETRRPSNADGTIEEKQWFSVLRDPERMEELDLQALGNEARGALQHKDPLQHNRDEMAAVIIRPPVIAMKYPFQGNQVRRFQVRFTSNEDYYEAMKILARANVPTLEAGTFPMQRPATAVSTSSTTGAASVFHSPSIPRPATAVSCASAASGPPAYHRPLTASSSLMLPPSHFSAPTSAIKTSSPYFPRPSANIVPKEPCTASVNGEKSTARNKDAMEPRDHPPPYQPPMLQSEAAKSLTDFYTPRASPAPEPVPQYLSQILPPRRELPFEKKSSPAKKKSAPILSSTRELRSRKQLSAEPLSPRHQNGLEQKDRRDATAESQESSQGAKKRKQSPTKAGKATAPKKPRTTPARGKSAKDISAAVPSVEDLLKDTETEGAAATTTTEDTQALLARASALSSRRPEIETTETLATETLELTAEAPPPTKSQQDAVSNLLNNLPGIPCTPADHLLSPSTAISSNALHTTNTTTGPIPIPMTPNIQSLIPQLSHAQNLLQQSAAFANSNEKLQTWADQPSEARDQSLDVFIADAYGDKNFHELCRIMFRKSVKTLLLWPDASMGGN